MPKLVNTQALNSNLKKYEKLIIIRTSNHTARLLLELTAASVRRNCVLDFYARLGSAGPEQTPRPHLSPDLQQEDQTQQQSEQVFL